MERNPNIKKKKTKISTSENITVKLPKEIDSYNCPICYNLSAEPVVTPCNHIICYRCILTLIRVKNACPICRQPFVDQYVPKINENMYGYIQKEFIEAFFYQKNQQILNKSWSGINIIKETTVPIKITVGNLWQKINKNLGPKNHSKNTNNNLFTLFCSINDSKQESEKYIEKVEYKLNESCSQKNHEFYEFPYKLKHNAKTYFDVGAIIHFKDWTRLTSEKIHWTLKFTKNGEKITFTVNIPDGNFE